MRIQRLKTGDVLQASGTDLRIADERHRDGVQEVRVLYPAYGDEVISEWYPVPALLAWGWRVRKA